MGLSDEDRKAVAKFQGTLQTDMKRRAEFIGGTVKAVMERGEGGPEARGKEALEIAKRMLRNDTPERLSEMREHFDPIVLELLILGGVYED